MSTLVVSYRPLPTRSDIVICRAIVRWTRTAGPRSESFIPSVILFSALDEKCELEGKFVTVVFCEWKQSFVPSSRLSRGDVLLYKEFSSSVFGGTDFVDLYCEIRTYFC